MGRMKRFNFSRRFDVAAKGAALAMALATGAAADDLHDEPGGCLGRSCMTPEEMAPHLVVPDDTMMNPGVTVTRPLPRPWPERRLKIYNTHTNERAEAVYRRGGQLDPQGVAVLTDILKDHRTGQQRVMNPELFDLLAEIQDEINKRYPKLDVEFQMVSGYRSPATNQQLKNTPGRGGQASNSRHTHGDAIDIRVEGVPRAELRNIAWCAQRGGVGDYPRDNFVHVDVYKQKRADGVYKNWVRYRIWGWQAKPGQCGPGGP